MLEEHKEIGRPFQCAGLVTPSAMDAVGAHQTVLQEVDGALIHGPSGTLVPVGTDGKLRTYVVCRKRFDQFVVQQGMEAGASLWLDSVPLMQPPMRRGFNFLSGREVKTKVCDASCWSVPTAPTVGLAGCSKWGGQRN